jgi:hypothetical protein
VDEHRRDRLVADLAALNELRLGSTILEFKTAGDPPERYTITLRGRGICRTSRSSEPDGVEFIQVHRCEIRLPYTYPKRSPDIHWLTPIFHPNVSFSGFLNPNDLGLDWDQDMGLDVVCERLWDVARMAHIELDGASNSQAMKWIKSSPGISFPVDHRPLRDKKQGRSTNIVRYTRKTESTKPRAGSSDVMFIGEDTPAPRLSNRVRIANPNNDDDILYISDD